VLAANRFTSSGVHDTVPRNYATIGSGRAKIMKSPPDFRRMLMIALLVLSTSLPVFWAISVLAHHIDWFGDDAMHRTLDGIITEAPPHLQAATVMQSLIMILATTLIVIKNKAFIPVLTIGILFHSFNWAQTTMMDTYNGFPGIVFLGIEIFVLYLAVNDLVAKNSRRSGD
jgi:hypothetical protein